MADTSFLDWPLPRHGNERPSQLLAPGWPRPCGYAHEVAARGLTVFTGGLVGWNEAQELHKAGSPASFARF